jgi:hypothetical protein
MMSCPLCHSKRIHRSRRKGIIESGILAMIFVRPFRCERCDYRFFRWSLLANPNPSDSHLLILMRRVFGSHSASQHPSAQRLDR